MQSRKLFNDYVNEIPKSTIEDLYIKQNLSYKDCAKQLNMSSSMFLRLTKFYGIKKPTELHTANIKQSKLEKFGDPNYNNHKKSVETNLKKYGVENQFQRKDLFPQIYSAKVEKYGSYNNMTKNFETREKHYGSVEASYEAQKQTYKNTCMARYGVENAASLESTKEKIRDSLRKTFLEVYGAENYWLTADAKRSNGSKHSKPNEAFAKKLDDAGILYSREIKVDNKIFDFVVNNTLIEIDPTATHNSTFSIFNKDEHGLDKSYHKLKTAIAVKNNYSCIHVFDWDDSDKIIQLLKPKQDTIGARKCIIKELTAVEAAGFLNKFHLQGYAKDSIRLGLYYNDKLVELMTFGKPRFNKNYEYELIRYCVGEHAVLGGGEKLFNYFINTYSPKSIVSYCDESKFTGEIYKKLNFKKIYTAQPSKHWHNLKTNKHITDNLLRQRGADQLIGTNYGKGTSNEVIMLEAGFVEVYDCGQTTYGWKADSAKEINYGVQNI